MSIDHATRAVTALRIHCPVDPATMDMMLAGQPLAIERDATLTSILRVVRADNPLGDFGLYHSVIELTPGWEMFTPRDAARSTLGTAAVNTTSPTAILTIYIPADAPAASVADAIDAIIAVHPWEAPVIEICDTRLVTRV